MFSLNLAVFGEFDEAAQCFLNFVDEYKLGNRTITNGKLPLILFESLVNPHNRGTTLRFPNHHFIAIEIAIHLRQFEKSPNNLNNFLYLQTSSIILPTLNHLFFRTLYHHLKPFIFLLPYYHFWSVFNPALGSLLVYFFYLPAHYTQFFVLLMALSQIYYLFFNEFWPVRLSVLQKTRNSVRLLRCNIPLLHDFIHQ